MPFTVRIVIPNPSIPHLLEQCKILVIEGGAIDHKYVDSELPQVACLAMAYQKNILVGVGAIKRIRKDYTTQVGRNAGVTLYPGTPELGYVAVAPAHREHGVAGVIVQALVNTVNVPMYATTGHPHMVSPLRKASFEVQGNAWNGRNHQALRLWVRNPPE
jgi:hypothetical protein